MQAITNSTPAVTQHQRQIKLYAQSNSNEVLIDRLTQMKSYNAWLSGVYGDPGNGYTWELAFYLEEAQRRGLVK